MKYRVAAILCLVCGVIAYPVSALLFPAAQKMSGHRMPDGSIAILSPTAGTWIFKLGIFGAIGFLIIAAALFWMSHGRRRQDEKPVA
jgi:hypothetical protein